MLKGIDVSHHNGNPDFNKAKAAGITFVYIKATEGVTYRDPMYQPNAYNALKAGLPIGFYHFARPGVNDPKDEAKNFVEAISPFKYTLLPVLDLEINPKGLSDDKLYAWASAFISEVKAKTGYNVMLYTYLAFLKQYPALQKLNNMPLWIAAYRSEAPTVSGWKNWTVWQYSDKENVPGVGSCDADVVQDLNSILINKPVEVHTPSSKRVLKLTTPMMHGEDVRAVQKRLNIPADGIFGPKTKQAVVNWQKAHDMIEDGEVDDLMWKLLFSEGNAFDKNEKFHRDLAFNIPQLLGADVKRLQKRLEIEQNGVFGEKTRSAVINWQKAHGFKATGGVGKDLWMALFPEDAKPVQPQPVKNEDKNLRRVRVIVDQLWVYNKPDWNAKYKIVKKGDVFEVIHRYKVGDGYMFQLKSGLYITANPKYVELIG